MNKNIFPDFLTVCCQQSFALSGGSANLFWPQRNILDYVDSGHNQGEYVGALITI